MLKKYENLAVIVLVAEGWQIINSFLRLFKNEITFLRHLIYDENCIDKMLLMS